MPDLALVYGSTTNLFIAAWLAIAAAALLEPSRASRRYLLLFGGRMVPLILLSLFCVGWILTRDLPGDITSFSGLLTTYSVPQKVLLSWHEILGLALLVARWMVDDADMTGTPRLILAVGLIGAFIAAAIGLVIYLTLSRTASRLTKPT